MIFSETPNMSEPNPELGAQFEKEDAERKAEIQARKNGGGRGGGVGNGGGGGKVRGGIPANLQGGGGTDDERRRMVDFHSPFYRVCQAAFYVMYFRGTDAAPYH